jgi:hypothetical protein
MFVVYHWTILYGLGQIAPTTYPNTSWYPFADGIGSPDFAHPVEFPPTNNIFHNETLFTIYADYLNNVLLPFARTAGFNYTVPSFLPVNNENRLQAIPASFLASYSCTRRQTKGWLSLIISVLVADYALIVGVYRLVIFIGEKSERFANRSEPLCHPKQSPLHKKHVNNYNEGDEDGIPLMEARQGRQAGGTECASQSRANDLPLPRILLNGWQSHVR